MKSHLRHMLSLFDIFVFVIYFHRLFYNIIGLSVHSVEHYVQTAIIEDAFDMIQLSDEVRFGSKARDSITNSPSLKAAESCWRGPRMKVEARMRVFRGRGESARALYR